MTAILGYADGKTVWIGGDSAMNDAGWTRFTVLERKVFFVGSVLIGISGRYQVIQTLQRMSAPDQPESMSNDDYIHHHFAPNVAQFLKQNDVVMRNDVSGTGVTIGYRGILYAADEYWSAHTPRAQVWGDGAGGDVAKGALLAFLNCEIEPKTAITRALMIAGEHDLTVSEPYYVLKTGG